jgi:hypothetical protein
VARVDDYNEAFRLASADLKQANLHRLAKLSGAEIELLEDGAIQLRVLFMGTPYFVQVKDDVEVIKEGKTDEVPIVEKVLICHYILGASGESASGELITFREVPDGHFYFDAFQRRARNPLLTTFGNDPQLFRKCADMLGGKPVEIGDVGMGFQVLPRIFIRLVIWKGDEEFPPEASILFDDNIHHYLSAEDIAVLSGMVVYPLIGMARSQHPKT